jgi:hypothetical protein
LVFVSVFLVEAWDRKELRLDHEGEEMIKTVERSCAGEVVVVMHVGGQVIVEDWVCRVPLDEDSAHDVDRPAKDRWRHLCWVSGARDW